MEVFIVRVVVRRVAIICQLVADVISTPPKLKLPEEHREILGDDAKSKRALKFLRDTREANVKKAAGVYALDSFVDCRIEMWKKDAQHFANEAANLALHFESDIPEIRRAQCEEVKKNMVDKVIDVLEWCQSHMLEQTDCIGAACALEEALPACPMTNRGLPIVKGLQSKERLQEHRRLLGPDGNAKVVAAERTRRGSKPTLQEALELCAPRLSLCKSELAR